MGGGREKNEGMRVLRKEKVVETERALTQTLMKEPECSRSRKRCRVSQTHHLWLEERNLSGGRSGSGTSLDEGMDASCVSEEKRNPEYVPLYVRTEPLLDVS